jgi:predicted O-linked N-acetylglucosamine transferase (SPINDLY family)
LLHAAGLPELIVTSVGDYEALALKLATERELLTSVRRRLADLRLTCALFDTDRFRRNIEAAYETMVDLWRTGERPRSFAVGPNGPGPLING